MVMAYNTESGKDEIIFKFESDGFTFEKPNPKKEKPFENIPDSKNYTLEECFNTEIRTRDGIKKLKDCTDEQLKILIAGSIQEIKDKANTILLFREGQK